MTEVAKQTDVFNRVSEQYKPYIQALRTPDINSQPRSENLKAIYKAIVLATEYQSTGAKNNEQEQVNKFLSEKFYDEICVKFHYARHGEIELSFRKGVLGEYGQYFGINVKTLYGWFTSYQKSQELKDAKMEWDRLMEESAGLKRVTAPVSGIFEISDENILNIYKEFLECSHIPVYGRVYYDAICKKKGIKSLLSVDVKLNIEQEAKEWYEKDLKQKKYHMKEPEKFNILMNSFDRQSRTFESVAKRLALKWYFEQCKATNNPPI